MWLLSKTSGIILPSTTIYLCQTKSFASLCIDGGSKLQRISLNAVQYLRVKSLSPIAAWQLPGLPVLQKDFAQVEEYQPDITMATKKWGARLNLILHLAKTNCKLLEFGPTPTSCLINIARTAEAAPPRRNNTWMVECCDHHHCHLRTAAFHV